MGLQIQRRVQLQLHQEKAINNENNARRFNSTTSSSDLPEALGVYGSAWLILTKTEISIKEIDAQDTGLELIGPGNGRLTKLLETLFGWSSMFRLHALYHDVFGTIYLKTKKGASYTYVYRNYIFKGSPIFKHLTGLLSCVLFGKNIGRLIVNKT